ncbi:carbohydrate ABC transporter permease [Robinsoniella sp.]|uniref:carbohydrate ABC transporter permease n=2 Tax=Robinsoniella TaxID=588605 RepID=UPI003751B48C
MMNKKIKRKPSVSRRQRRFVIIGLTPILLVFFVFSVIPIFYSFFMSLFNHSGFGQAPFVGVDNYIQLMHDTEFLGSLKNTVIFVLIAVNANIVISTLMAVVIKSVKKRKLRSFFRGWFFIPAVIPIVALCYVWAIMYQPSSGIINQMLALVGIAPVNWLTGSNTALIAIIITTLWCDLGYNIVLILAGMDSIPEMFLEAASIDGANCVQKFFRITLPLLSRNMLFVSMMTYITYFQAFAQIQIMTKGGPNNATNVIAYNIYNYAFQYSQMGYASAMAMVLLGIILIISMVQFFCVKSDWEY